MSLSLSTTSTELDLNLKPMTKDEISWNDFTKVNIKVGTIIEATTFEKARNPAYQLKLDFGTIGIKKTSAQITKKYEPKDLIGKQVIAVVNFPPKQIANFMSECLILGAVDGDDVILLTTDQPTENGLTIGEN